MKLSTLYTTVPEYIEFGWVTAPNAAGQSISANTITTLTLNTEVADTGSLVSAPTSNTFTLPAGTYYFEAEMRARANSNAAASSVLALYNTSDSAYVQRSGYRVNGSLGNNTTVITHLLKGQFVYAAQKTFDLRFLAGAAFTVDNNDLSATFTNSTAGADQRTTIKLWKLK
jgi:hypothetical protein